MTTNQTTVIGPKKAATCAVPRDWTTKRTIRMTTVIGRTKGSSCGEATSQAFDRREHRKRRRDHGIAVEERGGDDAEKDQVVPAAPERPLGQRHERERAALAVVVGADEDDDVFDRHHEDQRPEDQRQDAEDQPSPTCRHRRRLAARIASRNA